MGAGDHIAEAFLDKTCSFPNEIPLILPVLIDNACKALQRHEQFEFPFVWSAYFEISEGFLLKIFKVRLAKVLILSFLNVDLVWYVVSILVHCMTRLEPAKPYSDSLVF